MGKFEVGKYGLGLTGQENDMHKFVKDSWSESMKSHLGLEKEENDEAPEKSKKEKGEGRFESVKEYALKALSHINKKLDTEYMMNPLGLKQAMKDIGIKESEAEDVPDLDSIDESFQETATDIIEEIKALEKSPLDGAAQKLKELNQDFISSMKSAKAENKLDTEGASMDEPVPFETPKPPSDKETVPTNKLKQLEDIQDYLKAEVPLGYAGGESLESFLNQTTPDVKQEILQTVESWQEADRAEGGMHHDKIDPVTGKYSRQFYLSQVAEAAKQLTSKYSSGLVEQSPTEPVEDPVVENPEPAPEQIVPEPANVEAPVPASLENQTPEQPPVNSETQNPPVAEQSPTEPVEDPVVENPEPASEQIVPEPANVEAPVPASPENQTPEQPPVNEAAEKTVPKTTETPTETSPEQKVDFQQALNETFTKSGYFDSMSSILHTLDVASRDGQSLLIEQPVVDKLTSDFQEFYRLASGSELDEKSLKAITESLNDDFAKMQPIPSVGGRINLSVEFVDRMVDQLRAIGLEQNNLIQKIEQMDQSENHNKTADIRANMKIGLRLLEQKFVQLRKVQQSLSNYTNSSY